MQHRNVRSLRSERVGGREERRRGREEETKRERKRER